jgi:hypothetical protein
MQSHDLPVRDKAVPKGQEEHFELLQTKQLG